VMILSAMTYAAAVGAVLLLGAIRGLASGELDVARAVVGVLLVSPAMWAVITVRRSGSGPTSASAN
jgi:hypothetical protein